MPSNKIYCLVGPSGTGKDTVKNAINLPHIVSYRTRGLREGEVDGIDGHFISVDEYKEMESQDLWIASTCYAGGYYGITQYELFPLEITPLLYVVDWTGVVTLKEGLKKIKGYSPDDVVSIYLKSDKSEVYKRMVAQQRTSDEIARRMQQYDQDVLIEEKCDYVVENYNGKLDATVRSIYEIIMYEQGIGLNAKGIRRWK